MCCGDSMTTAVNCPWTSFLLLANKKFLFLFLFSFMALRSTEGHDLILDVYRSHNYAPQSVGLLWTSDQLVGKSSYPTTRNIHKRQATMSPAGFEPTIPASEKPQTHALDRLYFLYICTKLLVHLTGAIEDVSAHYFAYPTVLCKFCMSFDSHRTWRH